MTDALHSITAAILAGGLGTRLRPVVADRPKVLAPVAGRPFLAHLLDQLAGAGCRECVLLVGYGADQVRETFQDEYAGMRLSYSVEPTPLGTGGAARHALPLFRDETLLLLNGDSFCELDFPAFRRFHAEHGSRASLALARVPNAARFGRVRVGPDCRVLRFEEKNPAPAPGWINAGVYLLARKLLAEIPAGRVVSLEREVFPEWVATGMLHAFRGGGRFIDIGVPESYREAGAVVAAGSCPR